MYTRVTTVLLYEYRHLVGDVSAVYSVYATSWHPLLLALMVFDGAGIHDDPETVLKLENYLFVRRRGHDLCILADWPSPRQTTGR